jgi:hypothetical protein
VWKHQKACFQLALSYLYKALDNSPWQDNDYSEPWLGNKERH